MTKFEDCPFGEAFHTDAPPAAELMLLMCMGKLFLARAHGYVEMVLVSKQIIICYKKGRINLKKTCSNIVWHGVVTSLELTQLEK